ncbi:MAG TPA: NRDE family protein [Gammaproteobacteria bacterium]
MCLIVVALGAAPRFPLIVAANRDELHARPTASAAWWRESPHVLAGRDLTAGGTWLALDRAGRFAAVTNVREPNRRAAARSRGSLVTDFFADLASAEDYSARAERDGAAFGPFNLFLYDGRELTFASNRAARARLGTGLHSFSNAPAGVEWPKTVGARAGVERLLRHAAPLEPLFDLLAERDESGSAEERNRRTHFVVGPVYGTRCSTVVLFDAAGRATFVERSFDAAGRRVGEVHEVFEIERPR